MASGLFAHSLCLDVEIKMTDTQQTHRVAALLDSRATGLFLDSEFIKCHGLTMQPLPKLIPVYNINRMPNANPPPLVFPHWEALYKDNRSNSGALEEECGGEFSSICKPELPDEAIEVEDQIYVTIVHLLPSIAEIRASQTTSQQLAQAFATNTAPQEFWDVVPPYLHAFEDVFSKASFNLLLECKRWDHAIELLPNSAPSSSELGLWLYLSVQIPDGFSGLLYQKEGWLPPTGTELLGTQCHDSKESLPLPLISELINNLWGMQYFTKLDIWWSYNNVLTNSPATFQTMMNNIFWDLIVEGVVCMYLDNILIYTKMLEEHYWITCLILECLCWHQLYLKLEKCKFEQTQIEYLGPIMSHRTVEMDLVKVASVAEGLEPQNKEVQEFLGFANFYWRFIQDFLHHTCPLFNLTGKDVMWSWRPLEQMAFDTFKHAMISRPVLLFPDNNSPFHIEADSSNFATGAVL
ncbi:hypothetical protein E4T56_gene20751 [Termitomyces sp. T112]|nr:hypothetical protein E4T56_gene20751 [Termitomyces sp. T112]